MSHTAAHNPNLYQWKRFSKPKTKKELTENKPAHTDIEMWLKKVEEATEKAVKKTFDERNHSHRSAKRSNYLPGGDITQTVELMRDDDAAHSEAQELVSNWINEKIRYDFLDNEEDVDSHPTAEPLSASDHHLTSGIESATHEKWYEDSEAFIQNYLQSSEVSSSSKSNRRKKQTNTDDVLGNIDVYEADESTVVKALMKNMMEKPVIKRSVMKDMQLDSEKSDRRKNKFKDPRTTMEMRHKEVKEARLRRQREEEKRREERMRVKEARFKAQQILKEEEAKKILKAKKEEEAIQHEMAILRKEMVEQRKREEAVLKDTEREAMKQALLENDEKKAKRRHDMEKAEREKQKEKILSEISRLEEKERRIAEVMRQRNMENRKLMNSCFSSWCKAVLARRVKMGKAKAMADWKCMQRAWVVWKTYVRNQKLDEETRHHQEHVREVKLKEKKAADCEKFRLLRRAFISWKVWVKTEQERKEILKQQENTKAKMKALLNAVASGNVGQNGGNEQPVTLQSLDSNDALDELPHFKQQKPNLASASKKENESRSTKPGKPKTAWQVTKRDVKRLKPDEMRHLADNHQMEPVVTQHRIPTFDPYKSRHTVQKEIIDQQRTLLQEQKKMIEDMQEQQRLFALQQEIAALQKQQRPLPVDKDSNSITNNAVQSIPTSSTTSNSPRESSQRISSARSTNSEKSMVKTHPIVSKMEERAAERTRRRKELEEIKRKREEERVRRLQEEEERKQREEEEQKQREMEARREAKRLKKKQEEEKKAHLEHMRQFAKKADDHYRKTLMKNYGLLPWKKLRQSMEKKLEVASFHFNNKLMKATLVEWKLQTDFAVEEREKRADSLYRLILLRRGIRSWMKYGERMSILEQKAKIHHNKVLRKKYLKNWVDYTTDEKLSQWDKEARAESHNRTRMLRRVFSVIRSYRTLVLREEDRRKRLEEMRRKVTKMLPDFRYSCDSTVSDVTEDNNVV